MNFEQVGRRLLRVLRLLKKLCYYSYVLFISIGCGLGEQSKIKKREVLSALPFFVLQKSIKYQILLIYKYTQNEYKLQVRQCIKSATK
jgi:hypothetical protein